MAKDPEMIVRVVHTDTYFPTAESAWDYIHEHRLNEVAARNGATVGVRKKASSNYEIITETPKSKKR